MSDDMKIYVVTDEDGVVLKCFYSPLDASNFKREYIGRCFIQPSEVQLAKKEDGL
jgi:hypothetical protein